MLYSPLCLQYARTCFAMFFRVHNLILPKTVTLSWSWLKKLILPVVHYIGIRTWRKRSEEKMYFTILSSCYLIWNIFYVYNFIPIILKHTWNKDFQISNHIISTLVLCLILKDKRISHCSKLIQLATEETPRHQTT